MNRKQHSIGFNIRLLCLIIIAIGLFVNPPKLKAQESENLAMKLRLRRDFGLGIATFVRGSFSIRVDAPEEVFRVDYLIDGKEIGEDNERPFHFRFETTDYPEGQHIISAIGYTDSGESVKSNSLNRQFVNTVPTFFIIGVLVFLVVTFRIASQLIANHGSSKQPGQKVGYLGGAICPNCAKTYGIHWWSIRLIGVRLDRCPHCRSWKVISRASTERLASVDDGDNSDSRTSTEGVTENDGIEWKRKLDDSRFDS